MKEKIKTTLYWQVIILILGLFLIFTIREYLLDKNEITAETERARCVLEATEKELNVFAACADIKAYKLKSSNKGL